MVENIDFPIERVNWRKMKCYQNLIYLSHQEQMNQLKAKEIQRSFLLT